MGLMRFPVHLLLLLSVSICIITRVSSDIKSVSSGGTTNNTNWENRAVMVKGAYTNRRLLPSLDCAGLCKQRCRLHSRPNVCLRACGTCCFRCKCVPPGTSGNRELCGKCYTDMTTHRNQTKCP